MLKKMQQSFDNSDNFDFFEKNDKKINKKIIWSKIRHHCFCLTGLVLALQIINVASFVQLSKALDVFDNNSNQVLYEISYGQHVPFDKLKIQLIELLNKPNYTTHEDTLFFIHHLIKNEHTLYLNKKNKLIYEKSYYPLSIEQKNELSHIALTHSYHGYAQDEIIINKLKDNCGFMGYNSNLFATCYIMNIQTTQEFTQLDRASLNHTEQQISQLNDSLKKQH